MHGLVIGAVVIKVIVGGLAAAFFIYHVVVSLQSCSTAGVGWAFARGERPGLYWLQLFASALFAVYFIVQIVGGAYLALKRL